LTTTAHFVFAYIFAHFPGGVQYGVLFDGYNSTEAHGFASHMKQGLELAVAKKIIELLEKNN